MGRGVSEPKRAEVIATYGQDCWWCGCETIIMNPPEFTEKPPAHMFTVDHLIPVSAGGYKTAIENLRPACYACNQLKADEPWTDDDRVVITKLDHPGPATFSLADIWPRQDQDRSNGENEHQSTSESEPAQLALSSRAQQP